MNLALIIVNNCFINEKLSSEVISIKNIAHWQSNKNASKLTSFDNKLSSINISLIFNPNISPVSNIFVVLLDSKTI